MGLCCLDTYVVQDALAVWKHLFDTERPPVVIVGHSMGGAVAVRCAASKVSTEAIRHVSWKLVHCANSITVISGSVLLHLLLAASLLPCLCS